MHLTDATFDKAIESNPVALIDFWAEWCGPCIALGPAIEKLAAAYHNKALVGKLDAEKNQSTLKITNLKQNKILDVHACPLICLIAIIAAFLCIEWSLSLKAWVVVQQP